MSGWTGVVTNVGKALLASWVSGAVFNFDSAAGGTGTVPLAALAAQTGLVSQKQILSLLGQTPTTDGVTVKVQITAPPVGYTLNQIGIWGSVDGGTSVMMAIFQNDEGITIPGVGQTPDFVYNFYATIAMSNEGEITITVDTSALVSRGDFDAALVNKLDKDGDGSDVTAGFDVAEQRTNISTGEKLSVMMGKIAKFLGDLGTLAFKSKADKTDLATGVQDSLNKADSALQSFTESDPTVPEWAKAANKPSYNAAEVGAAPTNHNHAAGDINSGTLPVSRGGTGNSSIDTTPVSGSSKMVSSGGVFAALALKLNSALKGAAGGLAELGTDGRVPSSQLPSYVDDVLEYSTLSAFPSTGETGKIYVALDTNRTYRWSGSAYVEISPSLALGETSSTAYRGDRGKAAYDHSINGNVHVTPQQKSEWNNKQNAISAEGILKGDGEGNIVPAVSGEDFAGPTLLLDGNPTSSTVGAEGQMARNRLTGDMFMCLGMSGSSYLWDTLTQPPVYPQIVALVPTGSAVRCVKGAVELTGVSVGGECSFDVPDYGDWVLSATLGGQSSPEETVAVDSVKQYSVTLTYFAATLNVTAESGASVTATDGTHIYTGTCGSNGVCSLTVNYAGSYTCSATKNNVTSNTATANVTTTGGTYTATVRFITLTITIDSGSLVTLVNGGTTLTGTSTGTVKFYLPNTGTWTATATLSGETATDSKACSSYTDYTLELSYYKVFGVMWNYANQSTALTRLTKSNDPNGLVNVNITTNPSPAVGTGAGSSPFDAYYPWKEMEEYNIVSNAVSYKKGHSSFSRTSRDTVVKIPEYYFKVVDVAGSSKRYFYIADGPKAGFTKHPGSNRYVGKYNTGAGYVTKSGLAPLTNITRATARTQSAAKGTKWWQYDFATWCAIQLLYLVEFADWNSQAKIGRGYVDKTYTDPAIASGGTDSMNYHTGRAAGTDGQTAVQYRGIENLWGNVFDWVDGANFNAGAAYICTTPANFADDTTANYTNAGVTLPASGWIMKYGMSAALPWALIPNTSGGSDSTYVPDYVYSTTGWAVLCVGGYLGNASAAGLFYFYANYASSGAGGWIGARLLFVP